MRGATRREERDRVSRKKRGGRKEEEEEEEEEMGVLLVANFYSSLVRVQ